MVYPPVESSLWALSVLTGPDVMQRLSEVLWMLLQAGEPSVQGTVPYLGTFLTDLMMIDTAFRDTTDNGLINFDKRRREFEVLTQIKLFQSAASMYHILPDRHFADWFNQLQTFDDNERCILAALTLTLINCIRTQLCLIMVVG